MVNQITLAYLLVALATSAVAAPPEPSLQGTQLLRYGNSIDYEYALLNGTLRKETGTNDEGELSLLESNEFTGTEGTKFVDDENGDSPLFKKSESSGASIGSSLYRNEVPLISYSLRVDELSNLRNASEDLQLSLVGGGLKKKHRKRKKKKKIASSCSSGDWKGIALLLLPLYVAMKSI